MFGHLRTINHRLRQNNASDEESFAEGSRALNLLYIYLSDNFLFPGRLRELFKEREFWPLITEGHDECGE